MMSKEFSALGYFEPAVVFTEGSLHQWVSSGVSFRELDDAAKQLSRTISQTTPQGHPIRFYVARHAIPLLTLLFDREGISIWDIRGRSLGSLHSLTKASLAELGEMLDNVLKGRSKCNDCGTWVSEGKTHSYAGFVCNNCYDPAKHLPPNTD